MKRFERWEIEEVRLTFGLKAHDSLPILEEWLSAEEPIDEFERTTLVRHHARFKDKVNFWNEDEIKFFFLSHIISLVDFNKKEVYSTFTQRTLSAKVADIKGNILDLRGRVELMVALGEQRPRQPFFFLHEYKSQYKSNASDPEGQLMIAMVATQGLNEHPRPMYGVYVVGKLWQFVVLEGKNYAVSMSYDTAKIEDLFKVFSMLKRCKIYIEAAIEKM